MKHSVTRFENGLRLLEVPSHEAGSVVVNFLVTIGSRHEEAEERGLSHFLEHFLFKGTKKYPSTQAITQIVDGMGAEMNAATAKECTQYYIKAPADSLAQVFDILTDMLQEPLLDHEELEREKGVIVEEINMYQDSPSSVAADQLEKLIWPNDPLGEEITGTKASVSNLSREQFKSYLKKNYVPSNIVIGVGGKFDSKVLHELIHQYWTASPKAKKVFNFFLNEEFVKPRIKVVKKPTEQSHTILAFKGLPHSHKLNATMDVLAAILGGGMSSRLFTEVRERRGLAYYVRCGPSRYTDTGLFGVAAGVRNDKIEDALKVMILELVKIKEDTVPQVELEKAKSYIKGRTTLALEDPGARLDWYLDELVFEKVIRTPDEWFRELSEVTPEQVQNLAQMLFRTELANIVVVGKSAIESKLRDILEKELR